MKNPKIKLAIGIGLIVIALIITVIVLLLTRSKAKNPPQEKTISTGKSATQETDVKQIVAKVGEEELYLEDLEYELSFYPSSPSAEIRKAVIEKMIEDSIVLQAAQKEGAVNLDEKIYGARNKNYRLRVQILNGVKDFLSKKAATIEGKAAVIWFQNMAASELGYAQSKEFALQKITALHTQVKDKKISIDQAITAIKNDESLIEIDSSYIANAEIIFKVGEQEAITIDPNIDTQIRALRPGEVSEVMLGNNTVAGPEGETESFYMFAMVTQKKDGIGNYDEWLAEQKKNYETTIY